MHSTLKETLRCVLQYYQSQWDKALPTVLLALQTAVNEWGISPALAMFGEQISIPSGIVHAPVNVDDTNAHTYVENLNKHMAFVRKVILFNDPTVSNRSDIPEPRQPEFDSPYAWLRRSDVRGAFMPRYSGPYRVLAKAGMTLTL